MTHERIQIPYNTTRYDDEPRVILSCPSNHPMTIEMTFHFEPNSEESAKRMAKISFDNVMEFRWVDEDAYYERFSKHEKDFDFGLIQIQDSQYIQEMIAIGRLGWLKGSEHEEEVLKNIKHYRIGFDDHGCYDIICLDCKFEIFE